VSNKTTKYSISVEASTAYLAEVRNFVAHHALAHGIPEKDISEIRLAVDEAYTNIIKHAFKNKPKKPVNIEIGFEDGLIWITITDEGESFDPSTYSEPDLLKRIKNKQRGGMGVYLIRKLMDQVQYKRIGDINEIKMVKLL